MSKSIKLLNSLILTIRKEKVILDADLAEIYVVTTKALNQAIKRNADRFPSDFVFQLTAAELGALRSQFATLNTQPTHHQYDGVLRSQFVTLKPGRGQHLKYRPFAFQPIAIAA